MNHFHFVTVRSYIRVLSLGFFLVLAGCATTDSKTLWNSRVGAFTFDQAVLELGPPDKLAQLSDGTKVGEWMTHRGGSHGTLFAGPGRFVHYNEFQTPDYFLRLSFAPAGTLTEWKKLAR